MGEPLMQGDAYLAMLRHAREREIWVRTTTNASLLHLRENYRRLIDADPNEVQISIDGADQRPSRAFSAARCFRASSPIAS